MEEEKDFQTLFEENGYVIKNVGLFAKEASTVDLSELVSKLTSLESEMNKGEDFFGFANKMTEHLKAIQDVVNNDETVRNSDSSKLEDFKNKLTAINSKFVAVQHYIRAEELMNEHKKNLLEVKRQIHELSNDTTLNDVDRTKETLRLVSNHKKCEQSYKEASRFFYEQKSNLDNMLKSFNVSDFRNELLRDISAFDATVSALALSSDSKNKITEISSVMRNSVAMYGLSNTQSKGEFDALCARYGIEKDPTLAKNFKPSEMPKTVPNAEAQSVKKEEPAKTPEEVKKEEPLENITDEFNGNIVVYNGKSESIRGMGNPGNLEVGKEYTIKNTHIINGLTYYELDGVTGLVDANCFDAKVKTTPEEVKETPEEVQKQAPVMETPVVSSPETHEEREIPTNEVTEEPVRKNKVTKVQKAKDFFGKTVLPTSLRIIAALGIISIPFASVQALAVITWLAIEFANKSKGSINKTVPRKKFNLKEKLAARRARKEQEQMEEEDHEMAEEVAKNVEEIENTVSKDESMETSYDELKASMIAEGKINPEGKTEEQIRNEIMEAIIAEQKNSEVIENTMGKGL